MDWADAYMTDTYTPSTTPAISPTAFGCHERYDGNNHNDEFEYMCESTLPHRAVPRIPAPCLELP